MYREESMTRWGHVKVLVGAIGVVVYYGFNWLTGLINKALLEFLF
jgi:hypothetical protein